MNKPTPISVTVSKVIQAPADSLYDIVADITNMPRLSPETVKTAWIGEAQTPEVGARFKGTNRLGRATWSTKPTITAAERGHRFSFKVPGKSGAEWTYRFEPVAEGTRVTESMRQERPSPPLIRLIQRRNGVTDRAEHLRNSMAITLDRLAASAGN